VKGFRRYNLKGVQCVRKGRCMAAMVAICSVRLFIRMEQGYGWMGPYRQCWHSLACSICLLLTLQLDRFDSDDDEGSLGQ
jgi:hypothetical protein